MTLHETTENIKKGSIAASFAIAGITVIVLIFQGSIMLKNVFFPPKIEPPNMAHGVLPPLQFPQNAVDANFVYKINTATGQLPDDFPDRLNVYPLIKDPPGLLNLKNVEKKVTTLRFVDLDGKLIQGVPIGNANYEWNDPAELNRKVIFNIVSYDFVLTSQYLTSLTVLRHQYLSTELAAIQTAQNYLANIGLFPTDINLDKTKSPNPETPYVTFPILYSIETGALAPSTSLLNAQIIRVDFYQKNIAYELNTGISNAQRELQKVKMDLPILYPRPPFSTMNLFVASGQNDAQIVEAHFTHRAVNTSTDMEATYPIKSPEQAFKELTDGKAYIAASNDSGDAQILISKVYLAYYFGEEEQDYLMPIIVFEGQNGFFAYVSAVPEDIELPTEQPTE